MLERLKHMRRYRKIALWILNGEHYNDTLPSESTQEKIQSACTGEHSMLF